MTSFLAESYIHRLDPFAIQFTSTFGVRWYGLAYAVGFVLAWLVYWRMARTGRSPLTTRGAGDLMTYIIVGVLVGGRVGYALFYDRSLLLRFTPTFPFWDLLALNKGGMASHGGIIGVIVVCMIFGFRHKVSAPHLLDVGGLACTGGLFLGRLANFVNGELWGRPVPCPDQTAVAGNAAASPWWSIKYPAEITDNWEPAALEIDKLKPDVIQRFADDFCISSDGAASDGLAAEVSAEAIRRLDALQPLQSEIMGSYFTRGIVEAAYEGNQVVLEHIRPLLTAYYPSQLIQAITDGPILIPALILAWMKPRKPGVIGSWFLVVYGLLRIVSEQFRQPDRGVETFLGLSRGQVLSVTMVVGGIALMIYFARRPVEKLPGWFGPKAVG